MNEIALDPIGYSDALQKAGMPKAQADVIARTQSGAIEQLIAAKELATKADLKNGLEALRSDMKADMAELETRLATKMDKNARDMLMWFLAMFLAFGALIVAMLKS